jgi:hypothetical protein
MAELFPTARFRARERELEAEFSTRCPHVGWFRDDKFWRSLRLVRAAILTSGLLLVISGGVVHGLWTGRWHPSRLAEEAAARLETLPTQVDNWLSEAFEQNAEDLALTGALNHYSRIFTHPVSGEPIAVILLCGRPAQMVVHRPEHCYRAAGYEPAGAAVKLLLKCPVPEQGEETAEFFTGLFTREETAGPNQLRIFWSWLTPESGARWSAPSNPRFAFARSGALYKLYVIRNTTGSQVPASEDPAAQLILKLLPVFREKLLPSLS